MFIVSSKLKATKEALKKFHKEIYLPFINDTSGLEEELKTVQARLFSRQAMAYDEDVESELYRKVTRVKLLREEEEKQKSRVQWLQLGDLNIEFFQRRAKARRCVNAISKLQNQQGQWVEDYTQVTELIIAYYKNLLGQPRFETQPVDIPLLKELFPRSITREEGSGLVSVPSHEEIKRVF